MSLVSEEKVIPFLKDSPISKNPNLTPNAIPKRKRVSDIKKPSSMSSLHSSLQRIHRKRTSEQRPHPPDCLNKRYWDDVRAGRIPEPSWTSNPSTSKKAQKIPKQEPKAVSTSPPADSSPQIPPFPPIQMPFPGPSGHPLGMPPIPPMLGQMSPFQHGPLPFMPMPPGMPFFFDPLMLNGLANGAIPKISVENEGQLNAKTSHSSNPHSATPFQAATNSRQSSLTSPSISTSSDDQIDVIADALLSEVSKRNQENRPKQQASSEKLCIIPIPVPILLPIPLTSEFIIKYFSKNVANKFE